MSEEATLKLEETTSHREIPPSVKPWMSTRSLILSLICIAIGIASFAIGNQLSSYGSYTDTYGYEEASQWVRTSGYATISAGALWIVFNALRFLERRERERAKAVLSDPTPIRISGDGASISFAMPRGVANGGPLQYLATSPHEEKQERILEDSYIQGISQARVIFWVSMIFLCLGGCVLIGGAAVAILNGGSKGKLESGILAATSGIVSNLLSGVFLYQANRSRSSVSDQTVRLQANSMTNRRIAIIREVLDSIDSPAHKSKAQLQLVESLVASLENLDARHSIDYSGISGRRRKRSKSRGEPGPPQQSVGQNEATNS